MPTLLEVFADIIAAHNLRLATPDDYDLARALLASNEIQSLKTWIQTAIAAGVSPPESLSGVTIEYFQYE